MPFKAASLALMGALMISAPSFAEPVEYRIDSGHTHIRFAVERFGFANTVGVFPLSAGTIILDQDNPANSTVTASVDARAVWTGLEERDGHVRGPAWLNTEVHPEIRFSSTSVEVSSDTEAVVRGDFTAWGVTRPVSFEVSLNRLGPDPSQQGREAAGFTLSGSINRSDFGHSVAAQLIGDEVRIEMDVLAHAVAAED